MNIDRFFAHHQLTENPFAAEEAREDPIFAKLIDGRPIHPDFRKIMGQIDQASTSVVFGEKGSGKTAIRMTIAHEIAEHNRENPDRRVLPVLYDDLNPILDNLMHARKLDADKVLKEFRLEDHQDAILSSVMTELVDALLGENRGAGEPLELPAKKVKKIKKVMPREMRADLAVLAALYDRPTSGAAIERFPRLMKKLRLGKRMPTSVLAVLGAVAAVVGVSLLTAWLVIAADDRPLWLLPAAGAGIVGGLTLWGFWLTMWFSVRRLARKVTREMPAINRDVADMQKLLNAIPPKERSRHTFPVSDDSDNANRNARYLLTRRLLNAVRTMGYVALVVLIDRIDEPTLISGNVDKMRAVIWPLLDNKFLQQERIGVKMLLPIELRHIVRRESSEFFQEARLDKQNMIDRLTWSGATLYDLCAARMREIVEPTRKNITLRDLFEDDVSQVMLIDALDQMHQPRDAFKFVYAVIQEHCRVVPDEEDNFKIARLTLDAVRRTQSDRVQELYRGLGPA